MASSSSSNERKRFDVFISFRGEDTRRSFTSHLCKALRDEQIWTYMDEDTLDKGDEISSSLLKAIEDSILSVVVISEKYASSSWCLSELNHILHCKERANQVVVPIFYHVDPSTVRHQRGSFAEEFAKHEERFKDEMEKVHQWRKALTDVANISGFHTSINGSESDSRLIEKIVEDILNKLNSMSPPSDDLEDLFGIEKHIEKMESFLNIGSEDIRIVGIWGMGGLGKTTVARAVFHKISSHFQGSMFLENVKDEFRTKNQPITELQKKVFKELLGGKQELEKVTHLVKNRLRRTKVLFVLDDVDRVDQLEHLAKNRNWFGPGSRIIITTRDVQILKQINADKIYEMEMMSNDDAVRLFYSKAFHGEPEPEYVELSKRLVAYAQGNPLTLRVLGLDLYSRSIKEWESELEKLKSIPNQDVLDVLAISYYGLSDDAKSIFLDIACFFPHDRKSFVEEILSYRRSGVVAEINKLRYKSLIIVDIQNDMIWMHDLLRDTGREIVRKQSIDYPGMRSRLCSTRDACHVLANNLGREQVQGIALYLPEMEDDLSLKPTVFEKMRNLWFLKLYGHAQSKCKINIPEDLQLPDTLIYVEWDNFTLQSLPQEFMPNNLVELHMPENSLKQFGNDVKLFKKLKVLNLGYSKSLTLTNLSCAPNLETIDLTGCSRIYKFPVFSNLNCIKHLDMRHTSVEEVPPSIECLSSLIELDFDFCRRLKSLPSNIYKLKCLSILSLYCCSEFEYFPEILEPMECLQWLSLAETKIRELPQSIEKMTGLFHLELEFCKKLEIIPHTIHNLHSLEELEMSRCTNLKSLPRLPPSLDELSAEGCTSLTLIDHFSAPNLEERNFNDCSSILPGPFSARNIECSYMPGKAIEKVSSSITESPSPYIKFGFEKCTRLKSLPINILKSPRVLSFNGCSELEYFPEIHEPIDDLEKLDLTNTGIKKLPLSIKNLCGLKYLYLNDCDALEIIPHTIHDLHSLEKLEMKHCTNLKSLPRLPLFLKYLSAEGCTSLTLIDHFSAPNLEERNFNDCSSILPGPFSARNIECSYMPGKAIEQVSSSITERPSPHTYFWFEECTRLKSLPINILKSLRQLSLKGCSELEYFPEIEEPIYDLEELDLRNTGIKKLPSSIKNLCGLKYLYLNDCDSLEIIPHTIHDLHSLEQLHMKHCTNLKSLPRLPLFLKYLRAEGCTSLTLIDHFSAPNLEERNFNDCSSILPGPFSARNIECSYMPGKAIEQVSSSITERPSPHTYFWFEECTRLKSLPINILKSLSQLSLKGCSELEYFPEIEEPIYDLFQLDLTNTGIKKLPLSIKNLCGLKYLYLNGCDALEIVPHTISDIPLIRLELCRCKKIKSLPELPSSLYSFFAYQCESLEKVSIPWNALTEGPRNDIVRQKFNFYGCKKLDLESMLTQFKTGVFGAIHVSNSNCTEELKRYAFPAIQICFPGSNIPEWFDRKYCNEALKNVSLPPYWCKDNFMGFALCLVIGLNHNVETESENEDLEITTSDVSLICRVDSKTESGEKRLTKWHQFFEVISFVRLVPDFGDQMIMWSIDVDYGDLPSLEEVSFEFISNRFEVKGCGIRILYLQEAKEFRISHNKRQQRESNIVTDEAEPSDRGTSDSNRATTSKED